MAELGASFTAAAFLMPATNFVKKAKREVVTFVRNITGMGTISSKITPPEPYGGHTPKRKGRQDILLDEREKAGKNTEGILKTAPYEEMSETFFNHTLVNEGERPTVIK